LIIFEIGSCFFAWAGLDGDTLFTLPTVARMTDMHHYAQLFFLLRLCFTIFFTLAGLELGFSWSHPSGYMWPEAHEPYSAVSWDGVLWTFWLGVVLNCDPPNLSLPQSLYLSVLSYCFE
jgi:hypothetical protein